MFYYRDLKIKGYFKYPFYFIITKRFIRLKKDLIYTNFAEKLIGEIRNGRFIIR
jgi:hypothetical protein